MRNAFLHGGATSTSVVVVAVVLASSLLALAHEEQISLQQPQRPNIIWFITDDQDALLGSYDVMPTLQQRLQQEGKTFENAYVAAPKCCPSRTSAFSMRYPHNLNDVSRGWCGNFSQMQNETFVVALKAAGYQTAFTGKYYNEESNFCGANVKNIPPGYDDFFAMCEEVKYYGLDYNDNGVMLHTGNDTATDYLTAVLGNHSLSWLNNITAPSSSSSSAAAAAPFFLYFAPHAPHLPATPAAWYMDAPLPSMTAPRLPNWNTGTENKHWSVAFNAPGMDEYYVNASDNLFRNRLRTLMSVDDVLHDFIELLETRGLLDNTVIVYTSDHGYHLGSFSLPFEKSQGYETDTRIPFFVRGPNIPGNTTSAVLVNPLDIGPTILELAGVNPPGGPRTTDGRSFVSALYTDEPVPPPSFTSHHSSLTTTNPTTSWTRDRLLIEFFGWNDLQFIDPCTTGPNGVPGTGPCPAPPGTICPLIDAPSNTFAGLRIINATHNVFYAEYRGANSEISPSNTNFTEYYNLTADPYELTNLAVGSGADKPLLAQLSRELFDVANCRIDTCP